MSAEVVSGPTLRELADTANREHDLVVQAGASMVEHAIRAGEALQTARDMCVHGEWREWVAENLSIKPVWVNVFIRLAKHQNDVRASGKATITEAHRFLAEIDAPRDWGRNQHPPWVREEAVRLRSEGMTIRAVAKELAISPGSVSCFTDPTYVAKQRAWQARRREAIRLSAELQRDQQIKRAVKKAGAATAEAWAMAERMQDVLAQAHEETADREARRALAEAGVHYRKMRDEIVRALGAA